MCKKKPQFYCVRLFDAFNRQNKNGLRNKRILDLK